MGPTATQTTRGIDFVAPWLATVSMVAFAAIVLVEHVVNPSLDPATHELSEYVHARLGPMMTIGFACWATSLAAMTPTVLRCGARVVAVGTTLACLGVAVLAWFPTQTSAGRLPAGESLTTAGRLHDIGSGGATLALAFAVLASLWTLGNSRFRRGVILLLGVAVASAVTLLAIGPSAAGARQRALVAGACLWQVLVLSVVWPRSPRNTGEED